MNALPDHFPAEPLPPDTHLLGVSPPMLGLHRLVDQYVADGLADGEGCLVVTTDRDAPSIVSALEQRLDEPAFERLGIVDATSRELDAAAVPCRLESVSSPADLTGLGIGLSKLLEALHEADVDGYRVLIDSVSSLLVYGDFTRVYKFLHTVLNQVGKVDGTSVSTLASDTDQMQLGKLEGLYDGVIEVRDEGDEPIYRVRGQGTTGEWRPLPAMDSDGTVVSATASSDTTTASSATTTLEPAPESNITAAVPDSPDSLREIIDALHAAGLTLTLCNYTASEVTRGELERYFGRLNVTVRTAELSTDLPENVALLHRDSDVLAVSDTAELYTAISADALDSGFDSDAIGQSDVLKHVRRDAFTIRDGSKLELVRISRLIETRALRVGRGTLHAGFQRLDRIEDDFDTWRLYKAIAEAGVSVHLYGMPGDVPEAELFTLHTAEDGELPESWFVVYDGDGEDARKMTELCQETTPECCVE